MHIKFSATSWHSTFWLLPAPYVDWVENHLRQYQVGINFLIWDFYLEVRFGAPVEPDW